MKEDTVDPLKGIQKIRIKDKNGVYNETSNFQQDINIDDMEPNKKKAFKDYMEVQQAE